MDDDKGEEPPPPVAVVVAPQQPLAAPVPVPPTAPIRSSLKAPEAPPSPSATDNASNAMQSLNTQGKFAAAVQQSYDRSSGDGSFDLPAAGYSTGATTPSKPALVARDSTSPVPTFETAAPAVGSFGAATPSPSIPKPAHGRTVSWGVPTVSPPPPAFGGAGRIATPNRPMLPSWDGTAPTTSPLDNNSPYSYQQPQRSPIEKVQVTDLDKPAVLNVNDVINAGANTELEAETYILQAVEKKYANQQPSEDAETSRLYSDIVQDEIFQRNLKQQEDAEPKRLFEEEGEGQEQQQQQGNETGRRHCALARQPSNSTFASSRSGRFKGLVNKQMIQADTVEGTLFGLTSAFAQLDETQGINASVSASHRKTDSIAYDTKFTAVDKLAGAAQKMLNKDKQEADDNAKKEVSPAAAVGSSEAAATAVMFGDEDVNSNSGDRNDQSGHSNLDDSSPDAMTSSRRRHRKSKRGRIVQGASDGVKQEWELFNTFFSNRKDRIKSFTRKILVMIMLPSLGLAFFLFYAVGNPGTGSCVITNSTTVNSTNTTNLTAAPVVSVVPSIPPTIKPTMSPTRPPTPDPTLPPSIAPTSPTFLDVYFYDPNNNGTNTSSNSNATSLSGEGGIIVGDDMTIINENNTTTPTVAPTLAPTAAETTVAGKPIPPAPPKPQIVQDLFKCPGLGASVSWWFLFLGVRQVLTFAMALITQAFIVDYLALSSRILLDWFGPIVTLFIVQAKGWPFILFFWAIYDFVLLYGDKPYAHHWGYWQPYIDLFNDENPSGQVVNNQWNRQILICAIIIGVSVAVKRLVLGLLLGRQTFVHFGEQLAKVIKSMLIVGEVATLSRQIEAHKDDFRENYSTQFSVSSSGWNTQNIQDIVTQQADEVDAAVEPVIANAADAATAFMANQGANKKNDAKADVDAVNTSMEKAASVESAIPADPEFTESQQVEMAELLDAWEEPTTAEEQEDKKVTIGAVLQFRQALTCMKRKYPFLPAFGPADTRENCIESAQRVYDRLLFRTPHRQQLPFETLALLAKNDDGTLDQDKAKELIRAFRPDRDGTLGKLEFVKSIDGIYKELRLLSANITNSSQMDAAVENLVNIVFYTILAAVIISQLGEDPLALFFSFSSILLAFAFAFGKSASKYFDGCLFILVQRPYGVGDRIHLSNPMNETNPDGSSGWIVEKVALFSTSVYWGATNERATLCNGAISNSRVINAARSPNATIFVALKFAIDTEYEKIEIFRSAVEQYLKDRPREWLTFVGFRPSEVAVDRGFIGYKVIAQHRNSWQAIGGIIESKANLTTYCLEVARQLGMRYVSPSLPVDLTMKNNDDSLDLPVLMGDAMDEGDAVATSGVPANDTQDAMAAFSTGLRQRKGKSKFADLVRMAVEASKKK